MKKIAVLTWFNRGRNYGQTLQAFALNYTLKKLGYECELLSYGRNGPRLSPEEIDQLTGEARELQLKFTTFIKQHINYSVRLRNRDDVKDYLQSHAFDAVVCGSDQIWNAALTSFEPLYMFDFELSYRKVAYSVGMMELPLSSAFERYPQTASLLHNFDAISVREDDGHTIIEQLTGGKISPPVLLDPTLLLTREEWLREVELPPQTGKYVFCYLFDLSAPQKKFIQQLAAANHCTKVIFLDTLKSGSPDLNGVPSELAKSSSIELFLALIQNASIVVTDSFHGTVFSVQFEKEFFAVESASGGPERNTDRIRTLLRKIGLTRRFLDPEAFQSSIAQPPIDYAKVNQRLTTERRTSLTWLQQAIEGDKHTH